MTTVVVPAVAGIPLHHEPLPGTTLRTLYRARWEGSEVTEPPVVLRHVVGPLDLEGMREVCDARPFSVYYTAPESALAIRFPHMDGHAPEQMLVTVRPGYDYEIRYRAAVRGDVMQYARDRTMFSVPLIARRRGLVVHSAGFVLPGGAAVVAAGVSEAGKSTISRLLGDHRPDVHRLSDDRIVVTCEGGWRAWGTPWCGDAEVMSGASARLGAITFLAKAAPPGVRRITGRDAALRLFNTVTLPLWNADEMAWALEFIDDLVRSVRILEISYPPTPHGIDVLLRALEEAVQ